MHDKGETEKQGSLLVAKHGKEAIIFIQVLAFLENFLLVFLARTDYLLIC